jgi:hypothetical protein
MKKLSTDLTSQIESRAAAGLVVTATSSSSVAQAGQPLRLMPALEK